MLFLTRNIDVCRVIVIISLWGFSPKGIDFVAQSSYLIKVSGTHESNVTKEGILSRDSAIEELIGALSVRSANALLSLEMYDLKTVSDFVEMFSERLLSDVRGLGKKGVAEIVNYLREHGIELTPVAEFEAFGLARELQSFLGREHIYTIAQLRERWMESPPTWKPLEMRRTLQEELEWAFGKRVVDRYKDQIYNALREDEARIAKRVIGEL